MFRGPDPTTIELAYMICAFGGAAFFILRVVMSLVGGIGEGMDGFDGDSDLHVQDSDSSDVAFKFVSFNAIGAFFMMFGFAGLTSFIEFGLGYFGSLVVACLVGFFAMYLTALFFSQVRKLQSAGDDFNIKKTVGESAEVYQRIPKNGQGKVQITMNGQLRELDASTEGDYSIESFKKVVITDVIGVQEVVVRPAE